MLKYKKNQRYNNNQNQKYIEKIKIVRRIRKNGYKKSFK